MPKQVAQRADLLPLLGEVFREHGFEGASLALISQATGLGKGSLYHFFPGGKTEMAQAVLDDIQAWFEQEIFRPLKSAQGLGPMLSAVDTYFQQGRRVCLVGAFALSDTRDLFHGALQQFFEAWETALRQYFVRQGFTTGQAEKAAQRVLVAIQGALVLSRAMQNQAYFQGTLAALAEQYGASG